MVLINVFFFRSDSGVLDNRLVRRHTGVQVYSSIYLERRYAVPAWNTVHELHSYRKQLQLCPGNN